MKQMAKRKVKKRRWMSFFRVNEFHDVVSDEENRNVCGKHGKVRLDDDEKGMDPDEAFGSDGGL